MNGRQFFVHNDRDAVRVELAGSFREADVETLRQAWERAVLLSAQAEGPLCAVNAVNTDVLKPVIVDITFITDTDQHGRALVNVMHRLGVRIISQLPESSAIAQQIVTGPSAALPAQAEILKPASAGRRHASVEYRGPRDPRMLEDALRWI